MSFSDRSEEVSEEAIELSLNVELSVEPVSTEEAGEESDEQNVWRGDIGEPRVEVVPNDPGGGEETFDLLYGTRLTVNVGFIDK